MEEILKKAVDKGIISSYQKEELLKLYKKEKFNFSKIAVFLAEFLGIALVTSMIGMGLDVFGLMISSFVYLIIFYFVIEKVEDESAKKSASVFIMLLIPVFIASFIQYFHLLKGALFEKEVLIVSVAEILMALFLIKRVNFSFLVVFIVLSVYSGIVGLSMLLGVTKNFDLAAVFVGFYTMAIAYFLNKKEYSEWLYIIGSIMFWLGMSYSLNSEILYTLYLFANIFLFVAGVLLYKRIFITLSALGFLFYIWHLAIKFENNGIIIVFVNSLGFLSIVLIVVSIKYKDFKETFYKKFAFIKRIDKKWFLILLFFPFLYAGCYKTPQFAKKTANLKKSKKNQTKIEKRNFFKQKISDGVLIDLNCNDKVYRLRKLKAIFIENNKSVSKTIYVYKGYSFNSLEEFKNKYCH